MDFFGEFLQAAPKERNIAVRGKMGGIQPAMLLEQRRQNFRIPAGRARPYLDDGHVFPNIEKIQGLQRVTVTVSGSVRCGTMLSSQYLPQGILLLCLSDNCQAGKQKADDDSAHKNSLHALHLQFQNCSRLKPASIRKATRVQPGMLRPRNTHNTSAHSPVPLSMTRMVSDRGKFSKT